MSATQAPAPDVAMGPLNDVFKFFLANMPFNITPDVVRKHFSQFGPVNFVKIVYDKKSGQSRGYGFLYMQTQEGNLAVESYAAAHNGRIELMGRPRVFLARHDQKREMPIRNPLRQGTKQNATGVYGPASNQATSGYAPQQQHAINGYASAPATYAQPAGYAQQPQPVAYTPAATAGQAPYASAAAAPVAYAPAPAVAQPSQAGAYAPAPAAPVAYGSSYNSAQQYAHRPQQQAYSSNPSTATPYSPPSQAATPQASGGSYAYQQPVAQPAPSYPQQAAQPTAYGQHQQQQPQPASYGQPQQPQPYGYQQQAQPATYQQPQQAPPIGGQPPYAAPVPAQQGPPPPPPAGNFSTKVFLENLPTDVTPKDVVQCLAKHSVTCTRCTMEYDKDQKATWCYAHVDLATLKDTNRTLDLAQRSALEYRGRLLQASIDSLPPADGKVIPVGMGAPISTGPRPVSTVRGSSNDPRNRLQQPQNNYGGGRGGGRGGGGRRGRGFNRNSRRNRPY